MSDIVVVGMRDHNQVRVLSSALKNIAKACVRLPDKRFLHVVPTTPRSISGRFSLFDVTLFGLQEVQALVIASHLHQEHTPGPKRVRRAACIQFKHPSSAAVVKYVDERRRCFYFTYPGDLLRAGVDFFLEDGVVFSTIPDSVWTVDNPTTKKSRAFVLPPILVCLLTNLNDSAPCEPTDEWIIPAFELFVVSGTIEIPGFANLLIALFATSLFAVLWKPIGWRTPSTPSSIADFTASRTPIALRFITQFVQRLLLPVKHTLELEHWDISPLIPVFFPGVQYVVAKVIPKEVLFAQSVPDTLYVFELFSLPTMEFIGSRNYYIHKGFAFIWNSQLRNYFIRQLCPGYILSDTVHRASQKIYTFLFQTLVADLARRPNNRSLSGIQRAWLEECPLVARLHDMYLSECADGMDVNIDTPSLVARMKLGIETILSRAYIQPTWRYGKVDIKSTRDGNVRVSIRLLNLADCISPKCAGKPHKSSSHMFCVGFGHIADQPTKFFVCSNAANRHKPSAFQLHARIAEIAVPRAFLTESILVNFY